VGYHYREKPNDRQVCFSDQSWNVWHNHTRCSGISNLIQSILIGRVRLSVILLDGHKHHVELQVHAPLHFLHIGAHLGHFHLNLLDLGLDGLVDMALDGAVLPQVLLCAFLKRALQSVDLATDVFLEAVALATDDGGQLGNGATPSIFLFAFLAVWLDDEEVSVLLLLEILLRQDRGKIAQESELGTS